jgi:nucleotide-binding universal stress UspA family protein
MKTEFRRILVPLDGSQRAESALEALRPLIGSNDAEVSLLGVAETPEGTEGVKAYLEGIAGTLKAQGMQAVPFCRVGRPADEILLRAAERRVDLIALTTHGRTGLERVVVGSVTEEVLRKASVPLLVGRPGASGAGKTVVVALDGSEAAETILPAAAELARLRQGGLNLVKVALPVVAGSGLGEIPLTFPSEDPLPYLKSVAGRLAADGVTATPVGLEGRAASEILRHARESKAGLIAMTTHGRTGLARLLLGSIAEEVLRHSPCPVLVRRAVKTAVKAGGPA